MSNDKPSPHRSASTALHDDNPIPSSVAGEGEEGFGEGEEGFGEGEEGFGEGEEGFGEGEEGFGEGEEVLTVLTQLKRCLVSLDNL